MKVTCYMASGNATIMYIIKNKKRKKSSALVTLSSLSPEEFVNYVFKT